MQRNKSDNTWTCWEVEENSFSNPLHLNYTQLKEFERILSNFYSLDPRRDELKGYEFKIVKKNQVSLKINHHIGFIKIPSENPASLHIVPKLDIDYWKMFEFNIRRIMKVNVIDLFEAKKSLDVVFLVMKIFLTELTRFWRNFKRYNYRVHQQDLLNARGIIQIYNTYKNIKTGKLMLNCKYDIFTLDQKFNQVLKYALYIIKPVILSYSPYKEQLGKQLMSLWYDMEMVSLIPFKGSDINQFEYNPLNQDYKPLHQLAKIIIENGLMTPQKGELRFFSFLLNTWKLLEQFIEGVFYYFLPPEIKCTTQEQYYLKNNPRHSIFDFVFKTDAWWAIIDTKYKKELSRADYNQMSDYSANIKSKMFKKSEEIPDKVFFVFIYPCENKEQKIIREEEVGHFTVLHAPINLSKESLEDNLFLQDYVSNLVSTLQILSSS